MNCAELVTYDIIKELILKYNLMTGIKHAVLTLRFITVSLQKYADILRTCCLDNLPCHFTAAFSAGFCTTIVASPVDVVKTRFMNSTAGQYSSALNCALTMMTKEGPTAFYKGWEKHSLSDIKSVFILTDS